MKKKLLTIGLMSILTTIMVFFNVYANTGNDEITQQIKHANINELNNVISYDLDSYNLSISFIKKIIKHKDVVSMINLPNNMFLSKKDKQALLSDYSGIKKNSEYEIVTLYKNKPTEQCVWFSIDDKLYFVNTVFINNEWKVDIDKEIIKNYKIESNGTVYINGKEIKNKKISLLKRKYTIVAKKDGQEIEKTIIPKSNKKCTLTIEKVEDTSRIDEKEYEKRIFVGDSRTVGLKSSVNSDDVFICKVGMGYNWLVNTAKPEIDKIITKDSVLIINLGVNDLGNVNKYISYFNDLSQEYDCDIYIVSVNPVDEEIEKQHNYHVKNDNIDNFNKQILDNINEEIYYLDTNAYLKENGFSSSDGLHYDSNTYQAIYNDCFSLIKK